MYSANNTEHRANRISFYLFNSQGGLGIGSYFQDPITPGEWIHVVGVADTERTAIYKNGVFRKCDQYRGSGDGSCQQYRDLSIAPQHGNRAATYGHAGLRELLPGRAGGGTHLESRPRW